MKALRHLILSAFAAIANAEIVTYEAKVFPETLGWERIFYFDPGRMLDGGSFIQVVAQHGDFDAYRRPVSDFAREGSFFIEWRVETDAPASILEASGTPVAVSAGGSSYAVYHTTMTDARVQLFRDTFIPLVFVDIEAGVPHTYRVELRGISSYAWYIDGEIVDSGIPLGPYPTTSSRLIWGADHYDPGHVVRWEYLRCGAIPEDGSADYDSDGSVGVFDFYFFHECLSAGAPGDDAGPGCRFGDMDSDTDVDLHDFALFQNAFTGGN